MPNDNFTLPTTNEGRMQLLGDIKKRALEIQEQLNNLKTEPTIGEVFNIGDTDVTSDIPEVEETTELTEREERKIRRDRLRLFQGQIDAVNDQFRFLRNEARQEGEGRLGSQRAIAARGGLLGSDFAGAQKREVEKFNSEILGSIEAERSARVAAILGEGNRFASQEIAAKRAARAQGAEQYLQFLAETQTRKDNRFNEIINNLVEQGFDVSELTPAQLEQIESDLGKSSDEVTAQFNARKTAFDTEQEALAAEEEQGQIFNTSSGVVRVNSDGTAELLFDSRGNRSASSGSTSGAGASFTPTERKKLEQAGLIGADRQAQLDFLFGDKSPKIADAEQFITDNPDASDEEIRQALLERRNEMNLTVTDINALLDTRADTQVGLDETQLENAAIKLRKEFAKFFESSEDELENAIAFVESGKLTVGGRSLTTGEIEALVETLRDMGPRTNLQRVLPGGA